MEKFIIGALCGGIVGALAVSNNAKMRALVKKGEEEIKEKVDGMIDEKLTAALEKCDKNGGNAAQKEEGGKEVSAEEEKTSEEEKTGKKAKKKADKTQK